MIIIIVLHEFLFTEYRQKGSQWLAPQRSCIIVIIIIEYLVTSVGENVQQKLLARFHTSITKRAYPTYVFRVFLAYSSHVPRMILACTFRLITSKTTA